MSDTFIYGVVQILIAALRAGWHVDWSKGRIVLTFPEDV